jgi:threonine aldolase
MAAAEVGDDVFGDDPTVNALEARAAELLGKEAALFVASGTMGNLVAQLAHLGRGQESIASGQSHMVIDEAAGHAVIVGTSVRALRERPDGTVDPVEVAAAFRDPSDPHEPITGLVVLENTHAHSMGQPLSLEYTGTIAAVAHERGVPLHVDGARFFDAAVALGTRPADLRAGRHRDLLSLEGPRLPVGSSSWGGSHRRARRGRKVLGGGCARPGSSRPPGSSPCATATRG